MKKLNRKIFATAAYNTIAFGSGRKEFHPKKPMPKLEEYLKESTEGTCEQVKNPDFDEGVIGNFMASRFNRQGNLAGFIPAFNPKMMHKPCIRTEGACGSGGLAVASGIKSILTGLADSVFVQGVEVQNTMKAIYVADVLAGAGWYNGHRKNGHAYFFPEQFSRKAGAYSEKYGEEKTRKAMAKWYAIAIENARINPKAQEYHNNMEDLLSIGMTKPNPRAFLKHLNVFDCSKVTDGASSFVLLSEEGLEKIGVDKRDCVELIGFGQAEGDITKEPDDLTYMDTSASAAMKAFEMAGITPSDIGLAEVHDCFTITGLILLESMGFVGKGESPDFVLNGNTMRDGILPTNVTGGLVGFGHATGATGVRQFNDLILQFTGKADAPVDIKKPYGIMLSMGGNDKSVVSAIVKKVD